MFHPAFVTSRNLL